MCHRWGSWGAGRNPRSQTYSFPLARSSLALEQDGRSSPTVPERWLSKTLKTEHMCKMSHCGTDSRQEAEASSLGLASDMASGSCSHAHRCRQVHLHLPPCTAHTVCLCNTQLQCPCCHAHLGARLPRETWTTGGLVWYLTSVSSSIEWE